MKSDPARRPQITRYAHNLPQWVMDEFKARVYRPYILPPWVQKPKKAATNYKGTE